MATKKQTKPGKAVALRPGTQVATPGSWRERAAQSIARGKEVAAKLPQSSGNRLSFKGGVITLGGEKLSNPLPLVILAFNNERTYYSTAYQPDVFSAPDCYSLDGEKPAENAQVQQSDRCATCRLNEFGTSANGKGKGCKEGASFAAIHADSLESPERIAAAQMVTGYPSVINSKGFRSFMERLQGNGDPCWSVITTITNDTDPKTQYALSFEGSVFEQDDAIMDALAARVDEAERELAKGYTPIEEGAKPKAKGKPAAPVRKRNF